ncbi:integrase catalytic domain-containing protein [Pycnococcus provasolii]
MERRIAVKLTDAWTAMTGRRAIVLNDFTRGDLLLERKDGDFVVVQLKTTKTVKGNAYSFNDVCGYSGMPVVCFCEEDEIGWVADGGDLDTRAKEKLVITPGAKSERNVTRANGSMQDLLTYLAAHVNDWDSSTEEVARRDFQSEAHAKEMRGIDAWKRRFPNSNYEWPFEQNGLVDLLVDKQRFQFKSAHVPAQASTSGLQLGLCTSAGKDERGKIVDPYPHDAFDDLVVAWEEAEDKWHFWRIPADVLTARGHLSTPTQQGTLGMCVYGPVGVGRQPSRTARKKADTWTRDYYVPDSAAAVAAEEEKPDISWVDELLGGC